MSPDCLPGASFQNYRSMICKYHDTNGVYLPHITRLMLEKKFPENNLTFKEWSKRSITVQFGEIYFAK
jgi:hypothetical protein